MKELLTKPDLKFIEYQIAAYESNEATIGKNPQQLAVPVSADQYYLRAGKPDEIQKKEDDVVITSLQKAENQFIAALQVFFDMNIPDISMLDLADGKTKYDYLENVQQKWEGIKQKARRELQLGNYLVISAAFNEYLKEINRQRNIQIAQRKSKDFQEVLKTGM